MRLGIVLFLALLLCAWNSAFATPASDAVKKIFQTNCTSCHGGTTPLLFNILDVKDLEAKGILQGAGNSKLYKALNRTERWMPLGKDPLSITEKTVVLDWLTEGYPPFETDPPPVGKILGYNEETRCIRKDLFSANQVLARNYRYAVLADYYGSNPASLERVAEAVTKLFNSVSLAEVSKESKGVFIECEGNPKAILRLDLRALNQSADAWDNIVLDGQYPYFVDRRGIEGFEEAVANEKDIADITRAKTVAFVRADWLVETGSRDPVYSNLLFKDVKVKNIDDFERKFLRVDTFKQLFVTEEAKVAIFRRSGVTLYNRELHEYPLDFTTTTGFTVRGTYWKTFDVINDKDQRNFFAFPFGPLTQAYPWYSFNQVNFLLNRAFINDATEVIVNLGASGGGQFYSLFDGKGNRIQEADTQVAFQAANAVHPIVGAGRNGFTGKGGAVINGTGCFACHSGMNTFVEEGRKHVNLSTDFSNEQINVFNRISYVDQVEVDDHVKAVNAAYAVSQKSLGAKQVAYVDNQEPIFATTKTYLDDVDVCGFGMELNFTCDQIKNALSHAPDLARKLGLSETLKGKASRLNIEALQAQIARDLNLGVAVVFKKHDEPVEVCKVGLVNKTKYPQELTKVVFGVDKVYDKQFLGVNESITYDEKTAGRLDACFYYRADRCIVHKALAFNKCTDYQILSDSSGYGYLSQK